MLLCLSFFFKDNRNLTFDLTDVLLVLLHHWIKQIT